MCRSPRLCTEKEVAAYFAPLFDPWRREQLFAAHLNKRFGLVATTGSGWAERDATELPIRAIVRDALNHDVRLMLLVHNHPSGDPTPSRADIEVTRMLVDMLRPLAIRLHDHIIIARGGASTGFRAKGWL